MDPTPVDPSSDRPVFKQVADDLRRRVRDGLLRPGQLLPAEPDLIAQYGVGRNSLRQALTILRGEGLIVTTPRVGTRVRAEQERTPVPIAAGTEVTARMPTEAERHQHGMPLGVPVMVLTGPDGLQQVLSADRFAVVAGDD